MTERSRQYLEVSRRDFLRAGYRVSFWADGGHTGPGTWGDSSTYLHAVLEWLARMEPGKAEAAGRGPLIEVGWGDSVVVISLDGSWAKTTVAGAGGENGTVRRVNPADPGFARVFRLTKREL